MLLLAAAACAALAPGSSHGAYYETIAPFEHFTSARTQVFPHTCPVHGEVRARMAPADYTTPYIAVTRNRDQLYVYGYGADAARQGAYVADVDPNTLRERWRTRIRDLSPPGQWSYPGVMAVHGNGFLYAAYGNAMVKLDPSTGRTLARRELPEDRAGTGAAYNGFVVLPDGNIVAKKIERGPCATPGAIQGLVCSATNALPSRIVVVEPRRLRILSSVVPPEPVTGRVTFGGGHLYAAGRDSLFRYRYRKGRLRYDEGWGPVTYRTGGQLPGTGPGLLGGFLVVQTNFLPASAPLAVTAVSVRDSHKVFRIQPFAGTGASGSWIVSKPALDAANRTVVTHDTSAGQMAALRLDPRRGFSVRWRRTLHSLDFSALIGDAAHRQIVIPDRSAAGERVLWLSERTGRLQAQTKVLSASAAPGNIVTPGFARRFFYLSGEGRLWRLSPRSAVEVQQRAR
jgi:hypothetical protein